MRLLLAIFQVELALCAIFGLWAHNWPLIIGALVCFSVIPLVKKEETWEQR
jgi:hypothetical protein